MKNKEFIPVFRYSYSEAKRSDRIDDWKESQQENIRCSEYINKIINNNYDGKYLGKSLAQQTVAQFGYHRTALVLANTINHLNYDGRFSKDNKIWQNLLHMYWMIKVENIL